MVDQFQFVTKFQLKPQQYAWFLGAGTSAVAGLPTATDVIWDLKRRHYCREESQDISPSDVQIIAVRDRVQSFLESHGFPPAGNPSEYTRYFELIFGADRERQRRYLNAILSEDKVTLSVGNRVLAAMMASGLTRVVFTTNFDSVVERAYAEVSGRSISAYHLEGSASAKQALNNEEYPFYCKLHGDFRYDSIKNLSEDLQTQNSELGMAMANAASRFGFIVAGYSGRDESVMTLFRDAISGPNPFPHGLFWTGRKGAPVLSAVRDLLEQAEKAGVEAAYIEVDTYDAFMLRLWRNLDGKKPALDAKVRKTSQTTVNIPLPEPGRGDIVRFNALPILELPNRCLAVEFKTPKEWADLRAATIASEGALLFTKTDMVLCWGSPDGLREHFTDVTNITEYDLAPRIADIQNNLQVKGFLEEALSRALVRERPLIARSTRIGSSIIADPHHTDQGPLAALHQHTGKIAGLIVGLMTPVDDEHPEAQKVHYAESARVSIDIVAGQAWLVLDPDVWVWPPRAKKLAAEFLDKRRGDRFNSVYAAILDAWISILRDSGAEVNELIVSAFEQESAAENPAFRIGFRGAYSRRWQV
jgi:hypothetical protein